MRCPLDPDWHLDPTDWLIGTGEWILTTPCCLLPSLQSLVSRQRFSEKIPRHVTLTKARRISVMWSMTLNHSPLLHWLRNYISWSNWTSVTNYLIEGNENGERRTLKLGTYIKGNKKKKKKMKFKALLASGHEPVLLQLLLSQPSSQFPLPSRFLPFPRARCCATATMVDDDVPVRCQSGLHMQGR